MPYKELEVLPQKYEQAGYPPAAVEEARQITKDFVSELKRIEAVVIESITGKLSEEDLNGLIAFAKSELGGKLGKAIAEKRGDLKLTPEEQKQLQGFAKISWAWKFAGIPRKLAPVKGEVERSLSVFSSKMEDIKRRYFPEAAKKANKEPAPGVVHQ
jgi:hypothetical protein